MTFNYRTVADRPTRPTTTRPAAPSCSPRTRRDGDEGADHREGEGRPLDEADETLKLELLNPRRRVVRTATGTILNDDNNSKLSISDASADEPGTMTFTVTLSEASARQVEVNWGTADGTAAAGWITPPAAAS